MAASNDKTAAPFFQAIENRFSSHIVKRYATGSAQKAVILAYHNFPSARDNSDLQPDSVREDNFAEQMQLLVEQNFNIISLSTLVEILRQGEKIKSKTVVITCDDGYKTVRLNALPILLKYHLPATFFIAVDAIGTNKPFDWLPPLATKTENLLPMDWHDILELAHNGFEIGSHTCSHRFLPALNEHRLEKEVICSGDIIQDKIGIRPKSFALPFSFPLTRKAWPTFRRAFFELLERGDYKSCCTSTRGTIDGRSHPFSLCRFFINKYDDLLSFYAKALGAFAWTRFPQIVYQCYFKNYEKLDNAPVC